MKIEAGGYLSRVAVKFAQQIAIQTAERTLTFDQLRVGANRIGSGTVGLGVSSGECAGVLAHNRSEVAELWMGLERSGIVRVVLHTHFDMSVHVKTLNETGARAMFFDTRFTSAVEAHKHEIKTVEHFIAVGPNPPSWAIPYEAVVKKGRPEDPRLEVDEDSPCCIQLTTGTTGLPKPWIVTHRSWQALILNNLEHLDTFAPGLPAVGRDDVNLHFHALQWASGAQTMVPYLLRGAKNIILDDAAFDPAAIVGLIEREGVTGAFVPAPMLAPILDVIELSGGIKHRLRRLIVFFATPELLERTSRVLGPVWCHGFGSTEQGAPVTRLTCHEAAENRRRLGSVWRQISPFLEIAVVDEHGERVSAGKVGEIVVRSAMSASSYWGQPERTNEAFFPEGWFRPSDIGYMDEEGFLYYLDRAKDRIRSAAGIVDPHIVESALLRHDAVANCGVVGFDKNGAQEVVAAVQLKSGVKAGPQLEQAILQLARGGLAAHEVPGRLIFVQDLPTVLGGSKVQREVLQRSLAAMGAHS